MTIIGNLQLTEIQEKIYLTLVTNCKVQTCSNVGGSLHHTVQIGDSMHKVIYVRGGDFYYSKTLQAEFKRHFYFDLPEKLKKL